MPWDAAAGRLILAEAGGFSAVAIARGWLAPAWLSVPVTDLILAAGQAWLLGRGAGRDD